MGSLVYLGISALLMRPSWKVLYAAPLQGVLRVGSLLKGTYYDCIPIRGEALRTAPVL